MRALFTLYCFATFFLTAAAVSSHVASSAEMFDESPRIFSVCGRRLHDGLPVKGVLTYMNHAQSVKDVLPKETRVFIADPKSVLHLIPEYDIFSSSIFEAPYHSPDDFVKEGFIDPNFCLTDKIDLSEYAKLFSSIFPGEHERKPVWSMLHIGRLVSEYFEQFQMGFYASEDEITEDTGTDTWLIDKWRDRKFFLHVLEDELDRDIAHRLDPDENFLEWRNTKVSDVDPKFWMKLLGLIVAEQTQPAYLQYQADIRRYFKGREEVTLNEPHLILDANFYKFAYEERTLKPATIRPTGYRTDLVMVYRNGVWLDRLDGSILPKIGGTPFILTVGREHQFVQRDDGSKLGIHDYFQATFGADCLKPIAAADIPKYLS